KHAAPGFVVDLTWPLARPLASGASRSGLRKLIPVAMLCAYGFLLAVARTSTEFLTVLLIRSRDAVLLFPVAKLVPNVIAGTASGFITYFLIPAFHAKEKTTAVEAESVREADRGFGAVPPPQPLVATAADAGESRGSGAKGAGRGDGSGGGRGMGG